MRWPLLPVPQGQSDEVEGTAQRRLPEARCAYSARALRFGLSRFAEGALIEHLFGLSRIEAVRAAGVPAEIRVTSVLVNRVNCR
jgi:hypothetical protein